MDAEADQDQVSLEKRAARSAARAAVAGLALTERWLASARICHRVMAFPEFARATVVMLFAPLADEADLTTVLERCRSAGKIACAPRVDWVTRSLEPARVVGGEGMEWGETVETRHSLREPGAGAPGVNLEEIDLVLVPATAFDRECHRLGRGAGFYDRFLARPELRRAFLIGVGFGVQLVAHVPRAAHDRPVDAVVTDDEIVVRGDRRHRG